MVDLGPLPGPTQGTGLEARPHVGFWVNGAPLRCECGQSGLAEVPDRKAKPYHMLFGQSPRLQLKDTGSVLSSAIYSAADVSLTMPQSPHL